MCQAIVLFFCVSALCIRALESPDAGPRCVDRRCIQVNESKGQRVFSVQDQLITISWVISPFAKALEGKERSRQLDSFGLDCYDWAALDSSALPSFPSAFLVPTVKLERCQPPGAGRTYVEALTTLNVTLLLTNTKFALSSLELDLPANSSLNARHFAGLEPLANLFVNASETLQNTLGPLAAFITELRNLRSLSLDNVRVDIDDLKHLPNTLSELVLNYVNVSSVPAAILALPEISYLEIHQNQSITFDGSEAPNLNILIVHASKVLLQVIVIPKIYTLSLTNWAELRPAAIVQCDDLEYLELISPAIEKLPQGWLARCQQLRTMVIRRAWNLEELPQDLLRNAPVLKKLTLSDGALKVLPEGLLDVTQNLFELDLSGNHLQTLPSELFEGTRMLKKLFMSRNRLTVDGLQTLKQLISLELLDLSYNLDLTDLCIANGTSLIRNAIKLTRLNLSHTGITRICRDWRQDLPELFGLDFTNTNITYLTYADLQFKNSIVSMILRDSPITSVRLDREDYERQLTEPIYFANIIPPDNFKAMRLKCDCLVYWTWLALQQSPQNEWGWFDDNIFYCDTGAPLNSIVSPDELMCDEPDRCGSLPAGCECMSRPDIDFDRLVVVRCLHAGLRAVPPLLQNINSTVDLLLSNNSIADLRITDLPAIIRDLDLRNNSIVNLDAQTVTTLVRKVRSLYLSGNPLDCNCSAVPMLLPLSLNLKTVLDYNSTTCADGTALENASLIPCEPRARDHSDRESTGRVQSVVGVSVLVALLTTTLAVGAYFTRREPRLVCAAILRRWGLWPGTPDESDDGRQFDAFVTFSHEDEEFVRELVERLESGPTPYRLCLHYRDWVPGRMIPEQISESVRESRRTIALVSHHFLRSTWARAEFREAHAYALKDITPRLVVVLLEDHETLPLDDELRHYLAINTYVRWGEPWFWEKLRNALPNPRPPTSHPHGSPSASTAGIPALNGTQNDVLFVDVQPSVPMGGLELRSIT